MPQSRARKCNVGRDLKRWGWLVWGRVGERFVKGGYIACKNVIDQFGMNHPSRGHENSVAIE